MLLFLKVFFTEFIAEMGDKTQLMLIALTSKYKLKDIIMGTAAAILVLNGLAVLAGGLVSEFIPEWLIKIVAAFAFLYFAASTLAGDEDEEEEEGGKSKIKFAPLAVFCTFFVAELGDKTQLTAITFGANEGMGAAFIVWIGCSLGLFLADILGMLVGYLLKSKTPDGLLNTLAFVIFAIFGIYTAYQALNLISESVLFFFFLFPRKFRTAVHAEYGIFRIGDSTGRAYIFSLFCSHALFTLCQFFLQTHHHFTVTGQFFIHGISVYIALIHNFTDIRIFFPNFSLQCPHFVSHLLCLNKFLCFLSHSSCGLCDRLFDASK